MVADIDGTLLNPEKELTLRACDAVFKLRGAGLHFTLTSARTPFGVRPLAEELRIREPFACFNGALLVAPDLSTIQQKIFRSRDVAGVAGAIRDCGVDLWVFTGCGERWYASDLHGAHVAHEAMVTGMRAEPLPDIAGLADCVIKMVGVSDNHDAVAVCEKQLQGMPGVEISATRSQSYYLDVTHASANKGNALVELAACLQIPTERIATIGDMPTDVLMFRQSGVSIAMGNAAPEVQAAADLVTTSNDQEGFAAAMERYILAARPLPAGVTK